MIDGFVLAGGRSRRMGTDKALMTIQGQNMADAMAKKLLIAGCSSVSLIRKEHTMGNFTTKVVWDWFDDYHPLYGLYCAQHYSKTKYVVITPCDLPCLSVQTIQRLLAAPKPVIVANQPLLGVFPVSWKNKTFVFYPSTAR